MRLQSCVSLHTTVLQTLTNHLIVKKVLVTSLQFFHNLTMGNERLKMAFWVDMMFDNDLNNDPVHELPPDDLRVDIMFEETRNWLRRNNRKSPTAEKLIERHKEFVEYGRAADSLPADPYASGSSGDTGELTTEVISGQISGFTSATQMQMLPVWVEGGEISKEEQDRQYSRGSHELDVWWKKVRDRNYDAWVVPMETVDGAKLRIQSAKVNAMTREFPGVEHNGNLDWSHRDHFHEGSERFDDDNDNRSLDVQDGDEDIDEEEEEDEDDDDDESYAEGPLRGLLTEIPNILDTKQIEALHMTVKGCIVDSMGSGLTKSGENLQKTRCKMFLALDCGKNLLREMLVFVAVWEQSDKEFIFQITAQIIESFHHNALLPYAWDSLRIVKDIVSPAQTVMLRLINYMFRARKNTTIYTDVKDFQRDAKLIHFLFRYFRCRVVPDCIALIHAQAQIRSKKNEEQDFPVDLWDMERAKDGLSQYLDFLSVIADIGEMKPLLIEWELTYELIILLAELESGVERKPLVDAARSRRPQANTNTNDVVNASTSAIGSGSAPGSASTDATISDDDLPSIANLNIDINGTQAPVPELQFTPHKYPWSGTKVQILTILASLLAPAIGQSSPGNSDVQQQIMRHDGLMQLLNCTVYDGHQPYLKERTTLVLKWMLDGCDEAQQVVRELQARGLASNGAAEA